MSLLNLEIGCADYTDLRFDVRLDISPNSRGATHIGDMRDMSMFGDGVFGFVKMAAVFEHVDRDGQLETIQELRRVVAVGGLVWVQTPDKLWLEQAVLTGEITQEWYNTQMRGGERDDFDHHYGLVTADTLHALFYFKGFTMLWMLDGTQAGGSIDALFMKEW